MSTQQTFIECSNKTTNKTAAVPSSSISINSNNNNYYGSVLNRR